MDDIALISEEIVQAQEVLLAVENEMKKVGLHLNEKKTKLMICNQEYDSPVLSSMGNAIKRVDNFEYLGGWMESSEKDFEVRKALA